MNIQIMQPAEHPLFGFAGTVQITKLARRRIDIIDAAIRIIDLHLIYRQGQPAASRVILFVCVDKRNREFRLFTMDMTYSLRNLLVRQVQLFHVRTRGIDADRKVGHLHLIDGHIAEMRPFDRFQPGISLREKTVIERITFDRKRTPRNFVSLTR